MRALRLGLAAALVALLLPALLLLPARVQAQEQGRAGLVIVTGEGDPITRCVDLQGEKTSGYDLLAAAGIDIVAEQVAMGTSICSLDGVGCAFPADSCFCQCQGSPCVYWSYWELGEAGDWQYSSAGPQGSRLQDGDVDGWVWGAGTVAKAPEPPALTFSDICAAPEPDQAAAAAAAVTTAVTTAVPAAVTAVVPSATQAAAAPAPPEEESGAGLRQAALAALVVLAPLATLALLRRRRRS